MVIIANSLYVQPCAYMHSARPSRCAPLKPVCIRDVVLTICGEPRSADPVSPVIRSAAMLLRDTSFDMSACVNSVGVSGASTVP